MLHLRRILLIAKNEAIYLHRERILYICAFAVLCMSMFASMYGWYHFKKDSQRRERFQNQVRQQWLTQPDRHPHRVVHYGSFAFRPRSGLSYIDPGIDNFVGSSVYLEGHRQNTANFSGAGQSPSSVRFNELTLAVIFQQMIPLVIIFLGFSSFVREHEIGTRRILIGQGVSVRELILGKFLGIGFVLSIITILVLIVASLPFFWSSNIEFQSIDLFRIFSLLTAYGIYLGICIGLVILISALSTQSHQSLMILIGIWSLCTILMPKSLVYFAETIFPASTKTQSDATIDKSLAGIGDPHNPLDPSFQKLKEKYLAKYEVESVKDLPINFGGVTLREGEKIFYQVFQKHFRELFSIYRRQNQLDALGCFVNPFLAVRRISMGICGTDLSHFVDFYQAAEDHRYDFVQKLNEIHVHEIKWENDRSQRVNRNTWESFPKFDYQQPSLNWTLSNHKSAIISLAAYGIVTLLSLVWFVPSATYGGVNKV